MTRQTVDMGPVYGPGRFYWSAVAANLGRWTLALAAAAFCLFWFMVVLAYLYVAVKGAA